MECPTPCGKNADEMPDCKMASSEFQEPEPGELADLKIPSLWKPRMRMRWQRSCTSSQWRPGFMISNDSYPSEVSTGRRMYCVNEYTHLLHFQNEFVDCTRFGSEFPAISDGHGTSDIRGIVIPFASSVDKKDLGIEFVRMPMRKVILI